MDLRSNIDVIFERNKRVYFNIELTNPINSNQDGIAATYDQTFNQRILGNPRDYKMTVARMSVPGSEIPLLLGNNALYSITLEYNGNFEQVFLNFGTTTTIKSVLTLMDTINTAFQTAYLNLINASLTPPPDFPPQIVYDNSTGQLTVFVQSNYDILVAGAPTILIWVNAPLLHLLGCLSFSQVEIPELSNGRSGLLKIRDAGSVNRIENFEFPLRLDAVAPPLTNYELNPFDDAKNTRVDAYELPQTQGNCLNSISQLIGFVVTSNSFGQRSEYQNSTSVITSINLRNPNYVEDQVVFDLAVESPGSSLTDNYVYTPNLYRWIDINKDSSIDRIEFKVFYKFDGGITLPVPLGIGRTFSIKFLFEINEKIIRERLTTMHN